jgi:hypothetical protein
MLKVPHAQLLATRIPKTRSILERGPNYASPGVQVANGSYWVRSNASAVWPIYLWTKKDGVCCTTCLQQINIYRVPASPNTAADNFPVTPTSVFIAVPVNAGDATLLVSAGMEEDAGSAGSTGGTYVEVVAEPGTGVLMEMPVVPGYK